jgi:hypothetical protein
MMKSGGRGDPVEGCLHVLRRELGAVVELHLLAQHEGIGLAVLGDLPAVRQVGNDGLAAVARIAPHQVVEHATLAAQAVDGARLMEVEVRRPHGDAVLQHAALLGVGLGCCELEFRTVEFGRHALRHGIPWHAVQGGRGGRTRDELTTIHSWTLGF